MILRNISVNYFKAINPETCKKIISLGLSKMNIAKSNNISLKAEISEDAENQIINTNLRNSEVIGLNDKWLYDIFFTMMKDANISAGWNWHIDSAENMQFSVYKGSKENGGFYKWHVDGSSDEFNSYKPAIKISDDPMRFKLPKRNKENIITLDNKGQPEADMSSEDLPLVNNGLSLHPKFTENISMWGKVRKISMTLNLSDPKTYEGGDLKLHLGSDQYDIKKLNFKTYEDLKLDLGSDEYDIKKLNIKTCEDIRPQGSVIFFPGFTRHCVTPVTSGTRYSLVAWFLGNPWK